MKNISIISIILIMLSCSDNDLGKVKFDNKNIVGIWVPFEIIHADGTVSSGPFTTSSIFGVYAESVQLNPDKKYYPVIWTDKNNYLVKTEEAGDFEFSQNAKQLSFKSGPWDMEFNVINVTNSELWISIESVQYKLRRELQF